MTALDESPLPHPATLARPHDPVTFALETLEFAARNPVTTAISPAERRAVLYYTAAAYLAETYPEARQKAVYEGLAARLLMSDVAPEAASADELRVATPTTYGLACDRKLGKTAWAAAAVAALNLYRQRPTISLVIRSLEKCPLLE